MQIKHHFSGRRPTSRALWMALAVAAFAVIVVAGATLTAPGPRLATATLSNNPYLDPGTRLSGKAPEFTLTDQFAKPVSLRSFRGKVVILAFNDSECTTICPLTTSAMVRARAMLGTAAGSVQLLGIDANPTATSIADVRRYSELHGMVHDWHFLTGSLSELKQVWKDYKIGVAIEQGQIDHTPALFVIGPDGRLARLYVTQQSYAAVPQLAQLLAEESSRLLSGHPRVNSRLSYGEIPGVAPNVRTTAPRASGETIALGPGKAARLYLFFATWDQQVMNLAAQLDALNAYQADATGGRFPALTAIDEGTVEPSARTLPAFLAKLPHALTYPVGIDGNGRLADGYEVQDEPWFVLVSPSGQILWYYDIATSGWLSRAALERQVRNALARGPQAPPTAAAAQAKLAGSPPKLAALHAQANQLFAGEPALAARIRSLRGYPIVLNAWASVCAPCRAEFGLLATAAAQYGRRVAFLGADAGDDTGDARAFLAQHPVSYPSYEMTMDQIIGIVPQGLVGRPTTFFINRAGRIIAVHTGQYMSQGTLDGDIQSYALGS
jgi:cytochrome oxidase Cu insertion factor (SCO1/SenC/PrrC family)/thiol-disulfide isomerase/thioredoxin